MTATLQRLVVVPSWVELLVRCTRCDRRMTRIPLTRAVCQVCRREKGELLNRCRESPPCR